MGAFAEGMDLAADTIRLAEADGHPYTLAFAYRGGIYTSAKGKSTRRSPYLSGVWNSAESGACTSCVTGPRGL